MRTVLKFLFTIVILACLATTAKAAGAAELKLPVITLTGKTNSGTYTNVTITVDTNNLVMLRHSKGLLTSRFEDLPAAIQRKINPDAAPPEEAPVEVKKEVAEEKSESGSTNDTAAGFASKESMDKGVDAAKDFFEKKKSAGAMGFLVLGLIGIGFVIMAVGHIWVLVTAFRESVLWGLGSLCIGLVALIFVLTHWDKARRPFMTYLLGVFIAGGGIVVGTYVLK